MDQIPFAAGFVQQFIMKRQPHGNPCRVPFKSKPIVDFPLQYQLRADSSPPSHLGKADQTQSSRRRNISKHDRRQDTSRNALVQQYDSIIVRPHSPGRTCHALQNTRHLQNTQHWTNDLTRPRPVAMPFRKANIAEGSGERRESQKYGRAFGELSGVSQQRVAVVSTEPDKCYLTRNDPP